MMKLLTISIALILLSTSLCAKPWRGITPLHSSVSDVEHVLGKPRDTRHDWSIYQTDKETVSILYSNGLPCRSGTNSEWQLPKGKVVSITVAPKTIVLFAALTLDESRFQKLTDSHKLNQIEYLNRDEGESIRVVNGEISSFTFTAGVADVHLRCPSARAPEQTKGESAYQLDIYGNLRPKDEEIRLDNFAIVLIQRPETKGYIFIYSGKDMASSTARARARRSKNYLVRVRGIKPKRLVALYGGMRSDFTVQLYVVPQGAKPPSPFARP